jgi:branched-chain amino acid transport system permease protein
MTYALDLVNQILVCGLAALGLSICVGHTGQLNMAQAASFAAGAYAYAFLGVAHQLSGGAALAGAAAAAVLFAPAVALLALTLAEDEFVFGTLAFNVTLYGLLYNATDGSGTLPGTTWSNLTNGPYGITEVPPLFQAAAGAAPWHATAAAAVVVAVLLVAARAALASPWGSLLRAIRDSPRLALSLGKEIHAQRAWAAAATSFLGAMAGALYAAHFGYVDPNVAKTDRSVFFLAAALLGGAASFWGPLAGSAVIVLLPEALRPLGVTSVKIASARVIAYACVLLLLLHLRPQGLWREPPRRRRPAQADRR